MRPGNKHPGFYRGAPKPGSTPKTPAPNVAHITNQDTPVVDLAKEIEAKTATINVINSMITKLTPSSPFENSIKDILGLLGAQFIELKTDFLKLEDRVLNNECGVFYTSVLAQKTDHVSCIWS